MERNVETSTLRKSNSLNSELESIWFEFFCVHLFTVYKVYLSVKMVHFFDFYDKIMWVIGCNFYSLNETKGTLIYIAKEL
jgi:hypothetical protein